MFTVLIHETLKYYFAFVPTKRSIQIETQRELFDAGIAVIEQQGKLTQSSLAQILERGDPLTEGGNDTGERIINRLLKRAGWSWKEFLSFYEKPKPDRKRRK